MFGLQSVLLTPHQIPLTPQIVIEIPDDTPPESNFPSHTELDSPIFQQSLTVQNNRSWGNCSPVHSILSPHCNSSCAYSTSSQRSLRDFQTLNKDCMIDVRSLDRSHYLSSQSNYFTSEHFRETSPLTKRKLSNHIPIDMITPDFPHSNPILSRTNYSTRQSSCHCLNHNPAQCLIAQAATTHKMSNHKLQNCISDFAYCHTAQTANQSFLNPHMQHQSTGSQYSVLESQSFQYPVLSSKMIKPKKLRRLSFPSPNGSLRASSGVFCAYPESRPTPSTQTWKLETINNTNQDGKLVKFRSLPDVTKLSTINTRPCLRSSNPYASGQMISLVCQHSYRGDCLRRIAHRSPSDLRCCYTSVGQDCNMICSEQCPNQTFGTFGRRRHTDGCSIQPKSLLVINSYRRTRSVSSRSMHRSFDPIFQNSLNLQSGHLSKSEFSHSDYKLSTNNRTFAENDHNLSDRSHISTLVTDFDISNVNNVEDKLVQKSTTSFRLCSCPLIVLLVCMQLVLGCTATALSLFLMWILPTLQIQECAYWATVPLLLTGLLGTYFCPGLRLPPSLLHHNDMIKWTTGFLSLICSVLCLIICIFSGMRGNFLASLDQCSSHNWDLIHLNNKTNLTSVSTLSSSLPILNNSVKLVQQPCCRDDELSCKCYDVYGISISDFKQLSCRYLFSSIKDYLILQSALTGIGAAVCLWFCFILIENRFKLIMLRSRERFSFSSARSSLPGPT